MEYLPMIMVLTGFSALFLIGGHADASQIPLLLEKPLEHVGTTSYGGFSIVPDAYGMMGPLKQYVMGVPANEISCENDLMLLLRYDGSPACVTPETKRKLIERGWTGIVLPGITSTTRAEKQDTSETHASAADIPNANNQFALRLYSQISQNDKKDNVFFSPTSIFTAFAIAYEGAREGTAEELQQAFGFEQSEKRQSDFAQMIERYGEDNESYKLQMANALWLAHEFRPNPQYVETASSHYSSTVESVDFVTDEGVNKINDWVKDKTHDKIKQILEPGSTDEMTAMIITNTMYFNGKWFSQFNPDRTAEGQFWVDGENAVKAQMMRIDADRFNYAETDELQVLEMGYLGGDVSMLILLPHDVDGIHSLGESLDAEYLRQLKGKMSTKALAVQIPRFEFETEYDLVAILRALGVNLAFDRDHTNFSGIADEHIFIDQAIHKAFVGVDEEGTEAAAVTALVMRLTSGPPAPEREFVADRPFLFLIQDKETEQILFMGSVMDPTR